MKKSDIQEVYSLSPMQSSMLFQYLLEKDAASYFQQVSFLVTGEVDFSLFKESFQSIIQKYDIFRTVFVYKKVKKPLQVVFKAREAEVDFEDISHLDETEQESYLNQFIDQDREQGFDLSKDLLMRASILKLREDTYRIIWSSHHIIIDGWCFGLVLKEFFEKYRSLKQGQSISLEKEVPYGRYIQWLTKQDQEKAHNHWQEVLADYSSLVCIPSYIEKSGVEYQKEEYDLVLDLKMTSGLQQLSQNKQVTMNTLLQTIWGIILARYNNTQDVVFGSVVSGRPAEIAGVEKIVGLFINTVPVRVRYIENQTFLELIQHVQKETLKSEQYNYLPLAEIQARSELKQGLLDHVMVFENFPIAKELQTGSNKAELGFSINQVDVTDQINYFGIVIIPGERLTLRFNYNSLQFDFRMIQRMAGHIQKVVEQVMTDPELLIQEFEILTDGEKEELIHKFNDTKTELLPLQSIHQLFEEQVRRVPEKIALIYQDEKLSYQDLNEQANGLAWILREHGVTNNTIVGVMVNPSVKMAVSILAVLKAGGCYLPLDLTNPDERIELMIRDSGVKMILSDQNWEILGVEIINLSQMEVVEKTNLEQTNRSTDNAYLIYTSGTTGTPKGVVNSHQSVVNMLVNRRDSCEVGSESTFLQLLSFSFDAFVISFFVPLISGATIVLLHKEDMKNVLKINQTIYSHQVNHIIVVPSLCQVIIDSISPEEAASIKSITVGGERINSNMLEQTRHKYPEIEIINEYGVTEAAVVSVRRRHLEQAKMICIGKPISNTRVYILNDQGQLQPIGSSGELCISGLGVAKGYLNRPELTQEKFLSDPFYPDEMMYRTGDRARWLPDGDIEFLGRMDTQIKIRGFRIEIGEIEHRLASHPKIKKVAVRVLEKGQDKYLIGYFTAEQSMEVAHLNAFLAQELPEYMIPQFLIQLKEMPVNANGKIDRKALPEPVDLNGTNYLPPDNELEEKLVAIWQEILVTNRQIGVKDHFFELGGHSLKAMTMMSKIHKEFEVEIPLDVFFKYPTIRELARLIQGGGKRRYHSIQPAVWKEYYHLSSAQKRMYILHQLSPENTSYNLPAAVILEGNLNHERFEKVFQELIKRHEALCTSFEVIAGEPVQKIHQDVDFQVQYLSAGEEEVHQLVQNFIRPFDLQEAPLLRVALVQLTEERYLLLTDLHHIISDGASVAILIKEFSKLYRGEKLTPLQIQYKDVVEWEQHYMDQKRKQQLERYWLDQFTGELPILNLPTDHPRPKVSDYQGAYQIFEVGQEMKEKLTCLGRKHQASLYMVLLAAYYILLYKYSGQEEIVVGSPTAGRTHLDLENIIGMFVNTLALRNHPEGQKSFRTFLEDVRDMTLEAFQHQEYQFEELVEKLDIHRDTSRNPLFDSFFVLQNMEMERMDLGDDLEMIPYQHENQTTNFDLSLVVTELEEGLNCKFRYSTSLFEATTIDRMTNHYVKILQEISENPDISLELLDMVTSEEKAVLELFNDTQVEYAKEKTIVDLFEYQAMQWPEKVAVIANGKELTYRELNQKANQLARVLRQNGVQPDTIVGMLTDRSVEMILGIMAILKAGGAYLAIDPDCPEQRKAFIVEDSQLNLILTTLNLSKENQLIAPHLEWINLNDESYYSEEDTNLIQEIQSGNLAYVIYTSGSTGNPNGVLIEHKNVNNLVVGLNQAVYNQYGDNLKVALVAPYIFDASVKQIFGALLLGHSLYIVPADVRVDGAALLKFYKHHQIEISDGTPNHLKLMLQSCNQSFDLDLKHLLIGGEVLPKKTVKAFFDRFMNNVPKIENVYGPTECTVDTTNFTVVYPEIDQFEMIPIGSPLQNVQVYVLNGKDRLQPIGVAGELCITGDGVARGYLNRPELVKERFVANPFIPDQKMYRSGDLVRWLADGNIEYLGRIDHQVKIRGYRIELEEIEAHLLKHSTIQEAVVLTREDHSGDLYIVAYYTAEQELSGFQLKDHLAQDLPEYMIPNYFVQLDQMPLTTNGKINRHVLLASEVKIESGEAYVAPESETEKELIEIWQEILSMDQEKIGVNDNFFELGGHSLKATNLAYKIQQRLNTKVSLLEIFRQPTIRGLAQFVDQQSKMIYSEIQPIDDQEHFLLSSAQKRMFIIDQFEGSSISYNMPAILKWEGKLDEKRFIRAVQGLITRHKVLRTSFQLVDGEPIQKIHQQVDMKIDYTKVTDRELEGRIREFIQPFDLSQAPLIRFNLLKLEEECYVFMVDLHHIIADGISRRVLINEFVQLYRGEELSDLRIQYKDYIAWQQVIMTQEQFQKQEEYWLSQFVGEISVLDLPTDYPRTAVQNMDGDVYTFKLNSELSKSIREFSQKNESTLYMTVLAAFNILLHKYSRQDEILIGTPITNRPHPDLERMIGLFINTLVMKNRPLDHYSVSEFLMKVKDTALKAYQHQDYPLEVLIEKLGVERKPGRNPLFDVMFAMQNFGLEREVAQDFNLVPYQFEHQVAKFDLTLTGVEMADGIGFSLSYKTCLFGRETIQQMAKHLENLLVAITNYPEEKIGQLELISKAEKKRLVEEFNTTTIEFSNKQTIDELFVAQVRRTPDSLAVVFNDDQLTFRELDERSNQLAYWLRERGVGPEQIVAVLMERSLEMVIGILGILKAGGGFLPIALNYPVDRIEFMLQDSGAQILITQSDLLNKFEFAGETLVVDLQKLNQIKEKQSLERFHSPTNLCYVIYTSGTTGRPKGVLIEHKALVNYITWFNRKVQITNTDSTILLASYSFDGVYTNFWSPLITGSTLHMITEEIFRDANLLVEYIGNQNITFIKCTPSLLNTVINSQAFLETDHLSSLRYIQIGGEEVKPHDLKTLHVRYPKIQLMNHYGPTEATIGCISHMIDFEQFEQFLERPIIGKPHDNMQAYILDTQLKLSPIGVPGELCISGVGLARGYLNRLELTEEKFVSNPLTGERMYRTGDLARWLSDGTIDFLGRIDSQVKIRGYRIEPDEVRVRLLQHMAIRDAVVIARHDDSVSNYLVAYLVAHEELAVAELREFLAYNLPDYMIPSYFIQVKKLPFTPNGKLDTKALPKPDGIINTGVKYVAPVNWVEKKLVEIWKQILQVEPIGVYDNFFELGGNSLQLITLASELHQQFGTKLKIADLLQKTRIRELATHITDVFKQEKEVPVVVFNQGLERKLFCFPPGVGYGLIYNDLSNVLDNFALYAFNYLEDDNKIQTYLKMIKEYQPEGPYILFGYSSGGRLAFQVAETLEAEGSEVSDLIIVDSYPGETLYQLTDNELQEFEKYLSDLIDKDQTYALFKEEIVAKSRDYKIYTGHFDSNAIINCKIHLISSPDTDKSKVQRGWSEHTNQEYLIYQGVGEHSKMLSNEYYKENGKVIQEILNKIKKWGCICC